jgi:putative redox protein
VVNVSGRPFTIKKQFVDDLEELGMDESIRTLGRALLIFHSPADTVVSIDNAEHIFQTAGYPKSFVTLNAAHHLLLDPADATYVGKIIAAWTDRYIKTKEHL